MSVEELRQRADALEDLLSSSRAIGVQARASGSPDIVYLCELLIRRSFDELGYVQRRLEGYGSLVPPALGGSPQADPV